MADAIPLTLLAGFLGAGKTTLLNRILAGDHGERVAVVVNEFGDVGVDGSLVVGADEHLVELANGCLCCTVREDLRASLADLAARRRRRFRRARFDRVLVEASGLADPGPALQTVLVDGELAQAYRLDGVVTVACAPEISRQLEEHPEAAEQVGYADLVLLNHADRADDATLERAERDLAACNARARVERTVRAELDPRRLFGLDPPVVVPPAGGSGRHGSGVGTIALRSTGALDGEALRMWLGFLAQRRGAALLRVKGIVRVRGDDAPWVVQGVHQYLEIGPDPELPAPAESVLVVIGRDLDADEVQRGWTRVAEA